MAAPTIIVYRHPTRVDITISHPNRAHLYRNVTRASLSRLDRAWRRLPCTDRIRYRTDDGYTEIRYHYC